MPQYQPRAILVTAIPLPGTLAYEKWGGEQTAQTGDYLVQKGEDVYTVRRHVFDATYQWMGRRGEYCKRPIPVEVEFALADGVLTTLEGTTAYNIGDALLTGPAGDRWAMSAEKFATLYEPC